MENDNMLYQNPNQIVISKPQILTLRVVTRRVKIEAWALGF